MSTNNAQQVVTGPVRLSYVYLLSPKQNTNDDGSPAEASYSCMLLVPKTDTATIKAIRAAQQAALAAGTAKGTFGGPAPKAWKNTFRDGDVEGETPELEGHWFLNASSKKRPGVVDSNVQPILDATEVYSGMWARVALGAFAFNSNGNKGVSFGLNHVQKVRDDERLDGTTNAADVFDRWEGDDGDGMSLI